jgi:hypothetical protein
MKITFTSAIDYKELEEPQPASKFIPEWYKNISSYANEKKMPDGKGTTTATVKKCMPVFDAVTAGYIITSPADIWVSIKNGQQYFEWSNFELISFHPVEQASGHPAGNGFSYPKWNNPWAIKTPKGYSTLFVQPFHRESLFTILPGIVDTDTYTAQVNFPFTINDLLFEGLIPKGTPIAQVIPFKRDNWKMNIGGKKELDEIKLIKTKLHTKFFDRYKSMFRQIKEYK